MTYYHLLEFNMEKGSYFFSYKTTGNITDSSGGKKKKVQYGMLTTL